MAKTPDQTDGQPAPIEEATLFVSTESQEQEALAEEIVKRINGAFDSVGLTGVGEDYMKQALDDGKKERRFVSRGVGTGNVDYTVIDYKGSIISGSFSLGYIAHDNVVDSAGASFHRDQEVINGKEALELIDKTFTDLFPPRTIVEEFEA